MSNKFIRIKVPFGSLDEIKSDRLSKNDSDTPNQMKSALNVNRPPLLPPLNVPMVKDVSQGHRQRTLHTSRPDHVRGTNHQDTKLQTVTVDVVHSDVTNSSSGLVDHVLSNSAAVRPQQLEPIRVTINALESTAATSQLPTATARTVSSTNNRVERLLVERRQSGHGGTVERSPLDSRRPIRPHTAMKYHMKDLTGYEHQEIFDFPEACN
jgi:hypothetical protein